MSDRSIRLCKSTLLLNEGDAALLKPQNSKIWLWIELQKNFLRFIFHKNSKHSLNYWPSSWYLNLPLSAQGLTIKLIKESPQARRLKRRQKMTSRHQCVIIEEVFCYASPVLHWGSHCHLSHSVILQFLNPSEDEDKLRKIFSIYLVRTTDGIITWSQNAQQWNHKIWALWQVSRVCYLSNHRSVTRENVYNLLL